jgi:subfamily B ATP-binding cassette protein MsbA
MHVFKAVRPLLPLLRLYPVTVAAIVLLGTLSSLSEGIGISLFVPLFQDLSADAHSESAFLGDFANRLIEWVPIESRLPSIALLIFAAIAIKNALAYGVETLATLVNSRIGHQLRSGIFRQLMSVRYDFLTAQKSGKLLNTLASESWRAGKAIAVLLRATANICTIVVFTALLFLISWRLALLVVASVLAISLFIRLVTRSMEGLGLGAVRANQSLADRMLNAFDAMRVIRVFGNEAREQERFDSASDSVRSSFAKLDLLSATVNPLSELLYAALLLGILASGLVRQQELPSMLAFALVLFRMQPHVRELDWARTMLAGFVPSITDVTSFLDHEGKPYPDWADRVLARIETGIELRDVSFRYGPGEQSALQNLTVHIPHGRTTLIVGPSGAGKSTLVNLICGLYEVEEGEILVDGVPLRELDLSSWRRFIALAGQNAHLQADTIRANIAFGSLDASDEEIERAARVARAHDFIQRLPEGYDTRIGGLGVQQLSGGQSQRIALARALVRKPEILILDEAMSELDGPTELAIWDSLRDFVRPATIIAVTQRLSAMQYAHQVLVMEKGALVECGLARELLERGGLFARLYRSQHQAPDSVGIG